MLCTFSGFHLLIWSTSITDIWFLTIGSRMLMFNLSEGKQHRYGFEVKERMADSIATMNLEEAAGLSYLFLT